MKTGMIAVRFFVLFTILTGFIYPAIVTGISDVFFSRQAKGSLVTDGKGTVVGSSLIAQEFKEPRYFSARPSAVGYNPLPSGGTNLGPTSKALRDKWNERRAAGFSGDMLASSASGLDPHIAPESALAQVKRVALARNRTEEELRQTVLASVEPRELGFLGEPKVNVLRLNLLLDEKMP